MILPRLLLSLSLLLLACGAHAQGGAALPPSQAAAVEEVRGQLEQAELDEATRREVEAALGAAEQAEKTAEAAVEATRTLGEAAAAAERERAALRTRLGQKADADFARWQLQLPTSDDPEFFETPLAEQRDEVGRLRAELGRVADDIAALATPIDAGVEESQLRLAADELERRLGALAAGGDELPPLVAEARRARVAAELRATRAELTRRELERESAALRREHLELRQRLLQRELSDHEQRIAVLQRLIGERTDARLTQLVADLEAQQLAADTLDPVLLREAGQNLQIARRLLETQSSLMALRESLRGLRQQGDQVETSLADTEARVAIDAGNDALGLILLAERRRLSAPRVLAARLEAVTEELARARLLQIDLSRQRAAIDDPQAIVQAALAAGDSELPTAQVELGEQLYRILGQRAELLPRLDTALQRYVTALTEAEQTLRSLLLNTTRLRDLLDRQLFWIPSHAAVDVDWLLRQPAGWHDLLKPERLATSGGKLWAHVQAAPLLPAAVLIACGALLWWRRRAQDRLAALAPPLRRVTGDSYLLTAHALLTTLLAALPWALLLWLIGYSLGNAGAEAKYSDSLGHAIVAVAGSVLLLDFLRWLVVERGLAHLHFRWTRQRRQSLQRLLPRLALVLLPTQLLGSLAFIRGVDLAIDTAGRLAVLVFALAAAALVWWALAPDRLWSRRGGAPEPQRSRQLLRVLLPALLVTIAIGLLVGYVYSGWVLMTCLWQTVWAVLGVMLVHGMLARWFLLGERRLALKRLEAQRASTPELTAADAGEPVPELAVSDLTLEAVNAQTGRLLRALTLTLWVGALLLIWAEVLPALGKLDQIVLWSAKTLAEDGTTVLEAITLKQVLFGIVVLVLTFIAAGNLPGLLELGLLSRISIDASTRYAISSVSRYVIVIAGAIIGLGLLGLRWSQLQWLAAALSVGLGFGLQEIFGNFVSGLILLFERPFRVGDVITIGEFSGTVSRIRTRATTLIDFDNKEVVVPNKTFITDRLINWTLSDTRTRIIIKVGVAYGSDIRRVHALLQQAANEHALVLKDPAATSWFMAFGASSLDFELRVFVDALLDRLPVTSDLNERIGELFAEAGIEIAFPQLDLNVKHMPADADGNGSVAIVGARA